MYECIMAIKTELRSVHVLWLWLKATHALVAHKFALVS